jgi:hypothetical protein
MPQTRDLPASLLNAGIVDMYQHAQKKRKLLTLKLQIKAGHGSLSL